MFGFAWCVLQWNEAWRAWRQDGNSRPLLKFVALAALVYGIVWFLSILLPT